MEIDDDYNDDDNAAAADDVEDCGGDGGSDKGGVVAYMLVDIVLFLYPPYNAKLTIPLISNGK